MSASLAQASSDHAHAPVPATTLASASVSGCSPHHCSVLLRELNELRVQGQLTDIVLRCGDGEARAHKAVLAAASSYFKACLVSPMAEAASNVINLPAIPLSALQIVVSFAYTGEAPISEATVQQLLDAANQVELRDLVDQCCLFLMEQLDVRNCLGIHQLLSTYYIQDKMAIAEAFIFRNFYEVMQHDEFLQLPFDKLLALIRSDELCVPKEEDLCKGVLTWITHKKGRSRHISTIISHLRLQLVSASFLAEMIHTHEAVAQDAGALFCLLEAYRWHCTPTANRPSTRCYVRWNAVRMSVYAVGGDDGQDDRHPFGTARYYDENMEEWVSVAPLKQPRSVCGTTSIQGKLYVTGGYDGERALNTVEMFDASTNTWESLPQFSQRRCSCTCVELDDMLYVIGGVCGPMALNQVEVYDPNTRVWSHGVSMLEYRSACGAAVLNGKIYVVGGINGTGETLASAEVYVPRSGEWRRVAPLNTARRSFALITLGEKLYAIGGNDGRQDLKCVEIYDPTTDQWVQGTEMRYARMYCSACVCNGKIFAIGGFNDEFTLQVVEVYDANCKTWSVLPAQLPMKVCGCGVAVLPSVSRSVLGDCRPHTPAPTPFELKQPNVLYTAFARLARGGDDGIEESRERRDFVTTQIHTPETLPEAGHQEEHVSIPSSKRTCIRENSKSSDS